MEGLEGKFNAYEVGLIPHKGAIFEENGKQYYWNMANAGDSPEVVMREYSRDTPGIKPVDARYIETPTGKTTIVKWEYNPNKK